MRLSYALLLVAATTLVVSGETTPGVSRMASPDSVVLISGNTGAEKRFLRAYDNEDHGNADEAEHGDNEEDDDDEQEEREAGANMFAELKLNEMADYSTRLISRFRRWKNHGYNSYNLPEVVLASKYDELQRAEPAPAAGRAEEQVQTLGHNKLLMDLADELEHMCREDQRERVLLTNL
ncbi:hypothetical protein PF010_g17960 [Phytophthora fragariae]|uniref:RxLR effector protein n=1 Tax=Phytophthora fragariae TaxID=53985 RepID=A0A6G0KM37_9STRA|nr:hypothetical protein PF010_g17960 [Phytophthora fragariae]